MKCFPVTITENYKLASVKHAPMKRMYAVPHECIRFCNDSFICCINNDVTICNTSKIFKNNSWHLYRLLAILFIDTKRILQTYQPRSTPCTYYMYVNPITSTTDNSILYRRPNHSINLLILIVHMYVLLSLQTYPNPSSYKKHNYVIKHWKIH